MKKISKVFLLSTIIFTTNLVYAQQSEREIGIDLYLKGEYEKACKLHYQFMDILPLLYAEGSPGGIKAALNALKICTEHVRMPLAPVSKALQNKIAEVIKEKFEVVA